MLSLLSRSWSSPTPSASSPHSTGGKFRRQKSPFKNSVLSSFPRVGDQDVDKDLRQRVQRQGGLHQAEGRNRKEAQAVALEQREIPTLNNFTCNEIFFPTLGTRNDLK